MSASQSWTARARIATLLIAGSALAAQAHAQAVSGVEFLPIPKDPPAYLFAPDPLAGTLLRSLSAPTPRTGAEIVPEPGPAPAIIANTLPETGAAPAEALPAPDAADVATAEPLAVAPPALVVEAPPVPRSGTVTVIVENVESSTGMINVAVCNTGLSREGCPYSQEIPAAQGFVETEFDDIPPGTYAVVGYHDVNGNNEFDKLFGMPREPYALSSKAGEMLVPTFDDAALPINAGPNAVIIRLKRLGG